MFRVLKKLNPFYRKRRRSQFAGKLNRNESKRTNQIGGLFTLINRLENKLDSLIKLTGHKQINDVIMSHKDAKKYEDQAGF
tara:strand:+ start:598 stop:840 length:243 start_codon:yes stop_codon:yes gene_type:complete